MTNFNYFILLLLTISVQVYASDNWRFHTNAAVNLENNFPAVSVYERENTILVTTNLNENSSLDFLDLRGNIKSKFSTQGGYIFNKAILLGNGVAVARLTVKAGEDKHNSQILFVNSDGTLKVSVPLEGASPTGPFLVSPNRVAVINNESFSSTLYIFNDEGVILSENHILGNVFGEMSIRHDGSLVFVSDQGIVYFFNPDGLLMFQVPTGRKGWNFGPPQILEDDSAIIVFDLEVLRISRDGEVMSHFRIGSYITTPLSILEDGTWLAVTTIGDIFFRNPDGSKKYTVRLEGCKDSQFVNGMMHDTVALSSLMGKICFINSYGALLNEVNVESRPFSSVPLSNRQFLVVSTKGGDLFLIDSQGNILTRYKPGQQNLEIHSVTDTHMIISGNSMLYFIDLENHPE